jgi:truncated hemoglobin YjbI
MASGLAAPKLSAQQRGQQSSSPMRKCSMGYSTEAAIKYFLETHPEVPKAAGRSLHADPDTSRPLYFWQLYSVLGTDRIAKIVENLYARIAADDEEPWLPRAFTRISDWDHHVATQTAFWLDAMGRGPCYHGGEYRLQFHHQHNAGHVMTQVGAARWMHHMRLALDETDLGPDPRVRGTIDVFLQSRMEKYAQQHGFQTGDRVYQPWCADDWTRTDSWRKVGPKPKEPKQCPITGQVGQCEAKAQRMMDQSTSSGSSSSQGSREHETNDAVV